MDRNLVIGATISIVSSTVGALIAYLFNNLNMNKKRKWEMEDKKRDIRKEILLSRLEQFEKLVIDLGRKISIYESLIHKSVTYEMIAEEQIDNKFSEWNENRYLLSYLNYFGDSELLDNYFELMKEFGVLRDLFYEFVNKLKSGEEVDYDSYEKRKPGSKFVNLYADVLKRIDYLKEQYLTR